MQVKDILNSIKSLWNSITSINERIEDTGWQTATLTSDFENYYENGQVQYRKTGKTVEVVGIVKPTRTLTGSADWVNIFTLPERISSSKSDLCNL